MPQLNIRLTDEEAQRLRVLAGEGTVSDLIRGWIASSQDGGPLLAHLAAIDAAFPGATAADVRQPSFLVAPDDDCSLCGHDRQQYHLGPTCQAPVGTRYSRALRCGCPTFVEAGEAPI